MDSHRIWAVYETVMGQALPEFSASFAEDLFAPGKPCDELYEQAHAAGRRLCDRLDVMEEDPDVEEIFRSMEQICKHVAFEMFRCGTLLQKEPPSEV